MGEFRVEKLESRICLSADFFPLAAGFEAVDQGYNSAGETVLVGQMANGASSDAQLVSTGDLLTLAEGSTYETLVGLGPNTQVFGISSDGIRVAAVSESPDSVDVGEGTTWFSSAPNSPTGIGFVDLSAFPSSVGFDAWAGPVPLERSGYRYPRQAIGRAESDVRSQ